MSTLLKLVGYEGDPSRHLQLDGVDQSEALLTGQSVSEEMVYNLISDWMGLQEGAFQDHLRGGVQSAGLVRH